MLTALIILTAVAGFVVGYGSSWLLFTIVKLIGRKAWTTDSQE